MTSAGFLFSIHNMESLELFIRYAAAGVLATHGVQIALAGRTDARMRYYALLALGLIGFLLTHASVPDRAPAWLHLPLSLLSKTTALFIWWFVLSLFVDRFRLGRFEISFALVWVALLPFDFSPLAESLPVIAGIAQTTRLLMAVALGVYISARILAEYNQDLLSLRRAVRLWVAVFIVGIYVTDLASDIWLGNGAPELYYSIVQKTLLLLFAMAMMIVCTRTDTRILDFSPRIWSWRPVPAPQPDPVLKARLDALIQAEFFRDPDLSFADFARQLAAPEARARSVINQAFGYGNFRTFLNEHRTVAAKNALADPKAQQMTITQIAHESGFASLASFNRVFRQITGETPSAYRKRFL